MKISVDIEQLDNGFIVTMYDETGKAEYDQKVFIENLSSSLKAIEKWVDDITEREGNGEDLEEEAQ